MGARVDADGDGRVRVRGARLRAAGDVDLVLALAGYNNSWNPSTAAQESRWVLPRLWRILRSHRAGMQTDGFVIVDGRPMFRQPDGTLRPIVLTMAAALLVANVIALTIPRPAGFVGSVADE